MDCKSLFPVLMFLGIAAVGCGGKNFKTTPQNPVQIQTDPVKERKDDFLLRYGFFVLDEEKKELETLATLSEVDMFTDEFWNGNKSKNKPSRDPNPSTPENEFKDLIDQRIKDIEGEIFMGDFDIPGTRFSHAGGLRGDLAHVYLFYGAPLPGEKFKLSEGRTHVDLMAWYYFDFQGKPLFRFLFYNSYGTWRLFKNHSLIMSQSDLFNNLTSPLKEISNRPGSTPQELYELWQELEISDPQWIFRAALFQFSSYPDVVIRGGNVKRRIFGALDPPEPAAFTAARFKPTVLGQPEDLSGRRFIGNSYYSLIPAKLEIVGDRPSFTLVVGYKDIDWEVKDDSAQSILNLRMSFQNVETKEVKEFVVSLSIFKPRQEVEEKIKGVQVGSVIQHIFLRISLNDIRNFAKGDETRATLGQIINSLESGKYVLNADLRDPVTKKSAGGWREEIVIK